MKVLQQLIRHFWDRGALSMDQAHYLVEHGLIRSFELENYEPREGGADANDADGSNRRDYRPNEIEILPPDDLDLQEDALENRSDGKRKVGKRAPKVPELTQEQLSQELKPEISLRTYYLSALTELANLVRETSDFEDAAVVLRHQDAGGFHKLLLQATQTRPGVLRDLWCAVNAECFHDLLNELPGRGRVATAYQAVLNAETPAAWGSNGWILQVPEVTTVCNLLAVRRQLLAALTWMADNDWPRLTKCIQAPRGRSTCSSWDVCFLGLVLVVNARDHRTKRKPAGYRYPHWHSSKTWFAAWTTAMSLDAAAVMPFLIHVYGSVTALSHEKTSSLSDREDVEIYCPYEWKN